MAEEIERTPDGRYIVVNGRRWRATDPHIPEALATELRSELMAARRAIGTAKRSGDDSTIAHSRRRVADAKIALGERGAPWWEPVDEASVSVRSDAAVRALLRHRAPTSSICPSDVAKVVQFDHWRDILASVRRSVEELAERQEVVITRGDRVVSSFEGGPVRLRRGPAFPDGRSTDEHR